MKNKRREIKGEKRTEKDEKDKKRKRFRRGEILRK